jgi:hypothetical protein
MSEGMYMIHVRTSAGNKSVRVLKQTDWLLKISQKLISKNGALPHSCF